MSLDFEHLFIEGNPELPVLLLLHGTGGDEHDLLDLARQVAPGYSYLSPRGKVLENGMPRFFRHLAEGVFDLEDLHTRTKELAAFIKAAKIEYDLRSRPLIAIGFSNGANIAASLLLSEPNALDAAILLRAMTPFEPDQVIDLNEKKILMLSGLMDQIVPIDNAQNIAHIFESNGADLDFRLKPATHGLTRSDLADMKSWLAALS